MDFALTNSIHHFIQVLDRFISTSQIDLDQLDKIDTTLDIISEYKTHFANSNKKSIDIVKAFSGLNLLQNFLITAKGHLEEGVGKKENPKSAKEIFVFADDVVELSNKIDSFRLNSPRDIATRISQQAIELREDLRTNALYPAISNIENFGNKNGQELQDLFVEQTIQTF